MKRSAVITIASTLFSIFVLSEKDSNYGKFNLVITSVEVCKGPKKKDCGPYSIMVYGKAGLKYDFQIEESVSPTKAKVLAISNNNETLRLQINNPCNNLVLKPLFQKIFNFSDNSCLIKKGNYRFIIDFEDIMKKYSGGMHFFGAWMFRSHFYGEHCNLGCSIIKVKLSGAN